MQRIREDLGYTMPVYRCSSIPHSYRPFSAESEVVDNLATSVLVDNFVPHGDDIYLFVIFDYFQICTETAIVNLLCILHINYHT